MKESLRDYIKKDFEGAFFLRMVESVISRDKNWARWKIENCPSFARDSITAQEYALAKGSARQATTRKRPRGNNWAVLDLTFLSQGDTRNGLERLKDPLRYQLPSYQTFQSKIELDDMDIEMARDDETKNAAIEAKASKSWRALRIASGTKLGAFDKIERSDKIDDIFHDDGKPEEQATNGDEEAAASEEAIIPKDRRPIVISGPSGVGKGTLVTMLMEKHPTVLGKKASHTTRPPREGEVHGQHYFFVTKAEYDIMRDGDQFIEYNNFNGNDYGTSKKVVEGIIASGKVPVMEMDMHVSIIAPPMSAHLISLVRASSNSRTMDMLLDSFS
jgi:THO complex subunit 1